MPCSSRHHLAWKNKSSGKVATIKPATTDTISLWRCIKNAVAGTDLVFHHAGVTRPGWSRGLRGRATRKEAGTPKKDPAAIMTARTLIPEALAGWVAAPCSCLLMLLHQLKKGAPHLQLFLLPIHTPS
jgi:hypothetical protein